jgi:hypothetical protein
MRLYIKAISSYRGNLEDIDVKKELKKTYKLDTRRQDRFIHLALYGAMRLKEMCEVNADDELYITSGVGNMDIIQKSNEYVKIQKEILRPFDFINMLGNTTSYYVAKALEIRGKNLFQISNSFTFINSLISIYASLSISKKEAILGSVDLATKPQSLIKRVLGLSEEIEALSGVNYQKLSLDSDEAIACIEFDTEVYTLEEVKTLSEKSKTEVMFAPKGEYFETMASYYVNAAIQNAQELIYIDSYDDKYKIIKVYYP